jgi:membrane fusion protein, heavy metal efflux system
MHSRCPRPASCRTLAPFGGLSLVIISLLAIAFAPTFHARAHEGHVHEPAAPIAQTGLPRLVTKSESYELVALLDGKQLTIYLDRFADNSPLTDANISVAIEGETVAAERNPDGTYGVTSNLLSGRGFVELVFDIKAPEADDLLIGKLWLPGDAEKPSGTIAWYGRASSALRHGAEDHFILFGLVAFCGVAIGFALRPGRRPRLPSILSLIVGGVLCIAASERSALAHEGHDHGDDAKALATPGDTARRLPNGQVFVPKPMQRILEIRTVVARSETVAKPVALVGRVISNPNRSGMVQSITGGRVIAPEQGLPRLGQAVTKGEVLALIEPAMPLADRTTISERAGELEQMIAVAEAKLRRLRPLVERGVTPQSQLIDAETELEGLHRRRNVIRDTRVSSEDLRAPIDGVVALSRVVSGQVVQAQDLLFQIVDPKTLWVEAYDYGETDPATLKHATAALAGSSPMKLTFQGWSRTLQQQATVLQFAITDPPASIRVGQPVTVSAQLNETASGIIVVRDAIVRGGNGEAMIWRHVEPEHFEARPVRTVPLDAARVLIVTGVAVGDRVVVRGAELINQIR